jgi:hypothetical protein
MDDSTNVHGSAPSNRRTRAAAAIAGLHQARIAAFGADPLDVTGA